MMWRQRDLEVLAELWNSPLVCMEEICAEFGVTAPTIRKMAKANGLQSHSKELKQKKARRSRKFKQQAEGPRFSKGEYHPPSVAERMRKMAVDNAEKCDRNSKNDRLGWTSEDRSCYKRTLCQWPEEIDDNRIALCGVSVSGESPYCEQHRQLSTERGQESIGHADVSYLIEWWRQFHGTE